MRTNNLPPLTLIDINPSLVDAWLIAFQDIPEVNIIHGDILKHAENTMVSPANSYGDMGGGVDLAYRYFFGRDIERKVQQNIQDSGQPYLPIGQSLLVDTGHQRLPWLIVAPTMFLPEPTSARNCYLAMQAILDCMQENQQVLQAVHCPGLGTLTGRLSPAQAASTMAEAYRDWQQGINRFAG